MGNHNHCLYCGKEMSSDKYTNNKMYCRPTCRKKAYNMKNFGESSMNPESVRRFKLLKERGEICEICGFVAINKCQLDIDHIDGDAKNNKFTNLQILCANCHRLKTFMNKDFRERKNKGL